MTKTISHFLLLFFCVFNIQAQNDWHYLSGVDAEANRYDDVYFTDSLHGWACGPETVIRTTDAGITWDTIARNLGYGRSIEFINDSVGFIGVLTGSKFYKTTDRGDHWIDISDSLQVGYSRVCGIAHQGDTVLILGTWNQEAYMHISYNQGKSWQFTHLDSFALNLVDAYIFDSRHILVSGRSTDSIGDALILETTDGGVHWNTVFRSYRPIQYLWKLQYVNDHLMVGSIENRNSPEDTSFMVKSYDNGHTWQMKMVVPFNIYMQGIGFLNDSIGFCGGWSPGMYKTNDGGNTWNYYNVGANLNRFFVLNPHLAYACGQIIYKYDAGINLGISNPKPSVHELPNYIQSIYPNPSSTSNELSLDYYLKEATNVRLDLYSPEAKHLKIIVQTYVSAGTHHCSIELPYVVDGVYTVVLGTDINSHAKKIIIKN